MNEATRKLIDAIVSSEIPTSPIFNDELKPAEKVALLALKEYEQHGVEAMHYTQLQKCINVSKPTLDNTLKRLLKLELIQKKRAGFYSLTQTIF